MSKWLLIPLSVVIAAGYWLAPSYLTPEVTASRLQVPESCGFQTGVCEVRLPGDVLLEISTDGDVRPLGEFKVLLDSAGIQSASVSFEMVSMDMGVNRYRFTKNGDLRWSTKVMLPICTTNRTDWMAVLSLELNDGASYLLEYPFNAEGSRAVKH